MKDVLEVQPPAKSRGQAAYERLMLPGSKSWDELTVGEAKKWDYLFFDITSVVNPITSGETAYSYVCGDGKWNSLTNKQAHQWDKWVNELLETNTSYKRYLQDKEDYLKLKGPVNTEAQAFKVGDTVYVNLTRRWEGTRDVLPAVIISYDDATARYNVAFSGYNGIKHLDIEQKDLDGSFLDALTWKHIRGVYIY